MKKIIQIIKFLSIFIEDFFILSGLILIIKTTYEINTIAGKYLLGAVFLIVGYLLSRKKSPERR